MVAKKRIVIRVDEELFQIIDNIRREYQKKGLRLSYAEVSKLLAKKIKKGSEDEIKAIIDELKLF